MPDTGGGGGTTTVSNTTPWTSQEPYLQDVFAQARSLFEGPGAQYYPGQTVAGMTPEQMQALGGTASRAAMGSPLTTGAQNSLQGLIGGGITNNPAMGGYQNVANGGLNTNAAGGAINALGSSTQGPGQSTYQGLAGAGMGPGAAGYGNIGYGGQNTNAAGGAINTLQNANLGPAAGTLAGIAGNGGFSANDIFKTVQAQVQPAVASQYEAAGRTPTGSQGYAENLSRGLTQGFAPYALQAAQQGVQNQLGAAGQLQAGYGQQLNAAQSAGQLGLSQAGQNLQGQLAGLGGLQGAYGQQLGAQQSGAAGLNQGYQSMLNNLLQGGQLGLQQSGMNTQNQMAGLAGLGGLYQSGNAQQLQALGMAPGLANQDYNDLAQLYGVGSQLQGQNQAQINADMARYNYNQQLPMQQLAQYANTIGGNYGGNTAQTQPGVSPLQTGVGAGIGLLGVLGQSGLLSGLGGAA